MMTLWEAMLAGDWKVGKDRERRANANPSKYQIPSSVMSKITHEQVTVTRLSPRKFDLGQTVAPNFRVH